MFQFPAQLTITQIAACQISLLDEINNNEIIEFDDSAVERIDTLGVQLLLATVTYIAAQKKQLIWQSQSEIIKQGIEQLGLQEPILQQYITV